MKYTLENVPVENLKLIDWINFSDKKLTLEQLYKFKEILEDNLRKCKNKIIETKKQIEIEKKEKEEFKQKCLNVKDLFEISDISFKYPNYKKEIIKLTNITEEIYSIILNWYNVIPELRELIKSKCEKKNKNLLDMKNMISLYANKTPEEQLFIYHKYNK